jgi:hypothetical protein
MVTCTEDDGSRSALLCFKRAHSKWQKRQHFNRLKLFLVQRAWNELRMLCTTTHQTICSVNETEYMNWHYTCVGGWTRCAPSRSHIHQYMRSITRQYHLDICKSTVLRARAFCGRQCEVVSQYCTHSKPSRHTTVTHHITQNKKL